MEALLWVVFEVFGGGGKTAVLPSQVTRVASPPESDWLTLQSGNKEYN